MGPHLLERHLWDDDRWGRMISFSTLVNKKHEEIFPCMKERVFKKSLGIMTLAEGLSGGKIRADEEDKRRDLFWSESCFWKENEGGNLFLCFVNVVGQPLSITNSPSLWSLVPRGSHRKFLKMTSLDKSDFCTRQDWGGFSHPSEGDKPGFFISRGSQTHHEFILEVLSVLARLLVEISDMIWRGLRKETKEKKSRFFFRPSRKNLTDGSGCVRRYTDF